MDHIGHIGLPELVIADYQLPDGIGIDIARVARGSHVPTLITSACFRRAATATPR